MVAVPTSWLNQALEQTAVLFNQVVLSNTVQVN
jgi:hypothetical protein